jgi:hypothetical protein
MHSPKRPGQISQICSSLISQTTWHEIPLWRTPGRVVPRVSVEIDKAPMDSRVSASIGRNRVIRGCRGDANDPNDLVGSVLPRGHSRNRIREVRLIRIGH